MQSTTSAFPPPTAARDPRTTTGPTATDDITGEVLVVGVRSDLLAASHHLRKSGHDITTLADVGTAVRRLERQGSAAIVLDMRGLSPAVLDALGGGPDSVGSAVVAVIGTGTHGSELATIGRGCDELLREGELDEERLALAIARARERRRLRSAIVRLRRDLLLADANLLLLLSSGAAAILVLDEDGRIEFANHVAEALLGRSAHQLYGTRLPAELASETDDAGGDRRLSIRRRTILWYRRPATLVIAQRQDPAPRIEGAATELLRSVSDQASIVGARLTHALDTMRKLPAVLASLHGDVELVGELLQRIGHDLGIALATVERLDAEVSARRADTCT